VRAATGGEGVRLGVGADVELRHGNAVLLGQLTDDAVVVRHLLLGDGDGSGALDGELVGEPVGPADEEQAQDEPDDGPTLAEDGADPDEESAEKGEEDVGLEDVLVHVPYNAIRNLSVPSDH